MNELKTPSAEAEPDRSLTLSIHLGEAFMLRQALMFYRLKFPRNFDCGPPDVRDMVKALDCAMETADPKCMAEIQDTLPKLEPIVYKTAEKHPREVHHHHHHQIPRRPGPFAG